VQRPLRVTARLSAIFQGDCRVIQVGGIGQDQVAWLPPPHLWPDAVSMLL